MLLCGNPLAPQYRCVYRRGNLARREPQVLVLYRERSGEESSGKAGIVSAGAFPIQRLERSRFGTVELWVLNSGEGGEGWG